MRWLELGATPKRLKRARRVPPESWRRRRGVNPPAYSLSVRSTEANRRCANSHHCPRSSCCARGRSSAHMHHFVRDDVTFGRRGALWSRDAPILHRLLLHLLQHLNSPRP